MANMVNFEEAKKMHKSVRYTVAGYVRRTEALFPDNAYYNIPDLVIFMILFFYNDFERFNVNNETFFDYDDKVNGRSFHVYGTRLIERRKGGKCEWRVKISSGFRGRIGIIDVTNDHKKTVTQNLTMHRHPDIIIVGSSTGGYWGALYGKKNDEMNGFVASGDTLTIIVDFDENKITFKSKKNKKKRRQLSRNITSNTSFIRFIAEFNGTVNARMEFLK